MSKCGRRRLKGQVAWSLLIRSQRRQPPGSRMIHPATRMFVSETPPTSRQAPHIPTSTPTTCPPLLTQFLGSASPIEEEYGLCTLNTRCPGPLLRGKGAAWLNRIPFFLLSLTFLLSKLSSTSHRPRESHMSKARHAAACARLALCNVMSLAARRLRSRPREGGACAAGLEASPSAWEA